MNLVLLTFGEKLENHYQAAFSLLSFLRDKLIQRAIMVTDRPEFYRFLGSKVEILQINHETLKEWQQPHQFFWRVKMKALEDIARKYPNQDLLYVDSDTFLATDLKEISQKLAEGETFMHIFEKVLSDLESNTFKNMYKNLNNKTFSDIKIHTNSAMWNAGVIALPAQKAKEIIQLSLSTCDEMCETPCTRRLIEQFAFSVSLNHLSKLNACDHIIGHYWGNKAEWNKEISNFFVDCQLKQFSLEEMIEELSKFNWNKLPLEKKQRSLAEKLKKVIDKLFPIKHIRYFS